MRRTDFRARRAAIAFDAGARPRIYAASDFVVIPSRFEPCGLTQLYAMRFGAIPIVTDVGGLARHGRAIRFSRATQAPDSSRASPDVVDLLVAFEDALSAFLARGAFNDLRQRAMRRDSSWQTSAKRYEAVYAG